MKNQKRAIRRGHYSRLKTKVVKKKYWGSFRTWTPDTIGMCVSTPKPNKCVCCGNPRRYFGTRTLAELKSKDYMKEYYEEFATQTGPEEKE